MSQGQREENKSHNKKLENFDNGKTVILQKKVFIGRFFLYVFKKNLEFSKFYLFNFRFDEQNGHFENGSTPGGGIMEDPEYISVPGADPIIDPVPELPVAPGAKYICKEVPKEYPNLPKSKVSY